MVNWVENAANQLAHDAVVYRQRANQYLMQSKTAPRYKLTRQGFDVPRDRLIGLAKTCHDMADEAIRQSENLQALHGRKQ